MKKILLTWLTITSLLLAWCGWNTNTAWWSSSSTAKGKDYKIKLYTCTSKDLKWWCSQTDKKTVGIFKTDNLCSLVEVTDKDEVKTSDLFKDGVNAKLIKVNVDPKTKIVNVSAYEKKKSLSTNEKNPKNIDVLFDLTYYSTDNQDLEKEVIQTRKKKLKDELEQNLNPGDKLTLRYIWTIDNGTYPEHKDAVLKDIDEFKLKGATNEKVETKYYDLTIRCKAFKRTKTMKIYTHLDQNKNEKLNSKTDKNNIPSYNTKNNLISAIFNKIDNKYNSWKYSYGTYFLETLSNYNEFLKRKDYTKDDVNIIVSDFRFQLHPTMKKNKNIPDDVNWSFPPVKVNMWKKWTKYYNFYTKTIPTYFTYICSHQEKLNLIWLETDNIEIKKIMKDYYKNYLFKKCKVEFK